MHAIWALGRFEGLVEALPTTEAVLRERERERARERERERERDKKLRALGDPRCMHGGRVGPGQGLSILMDSTYGLCRDVALALRVEGVEFGVWSLGFGGCRGFTAIGFIVEG